ncbi:hypothetical protein I2492_07505 [Budviciaceae bacterium CWB-B4]|uniref:Uncharacterized protein n=1 Tax=Limnobaculum xujianqingii TaxID=2738837 RepID=A0A9D7AHJ5_9GAMM|nr:FidL-like protein [Limnobaculum xujianqingii]MBK5072859.1 hypothetical protein [Limnobaculum xujianqingii]MBK5176168.1 hypothetical protein [Limnobaculum xujianqingii]
MNNIKFSVIATLIVTALLAVGLYLFYASSNNKFTCSANTTYLFEKISKEKEALLTSEMRFHFDGDGKGYNIIVGNLLVDGNNYTINRKVQFDYTYNKTNNYVLNTTQVSLENTDNLPKALGERYLYRFSTEQHESTHLVIIRMNSGKRLFSSGTLPYFLCE